MLGLSCSSEIPTDHTELPLWAKFEAEIPSPRDVFDRRRGFYSGALDRIQTRSPSINPSLTVAV